MPSTTTTSKPELSPIYVRVSREVADGMRAVAAANDRPLSREIGRAFTAHINRHREAKPE